MSSLRDLPFSLSDALLVLWFHDLEKPWKYSGDPDVSARLSGKRDRKRFRLRMASDYDIRFTDEQLNALEFVEGENDDHVPGARVMGPLAAFCHMCDIASARIWFEQPGGEGDGWGCRIAGN